MAEATLIIIICLCIFMGIATGMYLASQIGDWIDKNTKK
jgi:uncharacterized protein YneF (UPF0154 family)